MATYNSAKFISNQLDLILSQIGPLDAKRPIVLGRLAKVCDAYIYYECVNLISSVYKYNDEKNFNAELNACHNLIREHLVSSMLNPFWSLNHKVKYFLVTYLPGVYKTLLRLIK